MSLHPYFDDISLSPVFRDLKGYRLKHLSGDLAAGMSVALLTLPQAMAYALVARLPLSTSLFAAIFSCMIAALFSSSRHLLVGPSNAIAILIQYGTAEILYNNFRDLSGAERDFVAFQVMTQVTLIVALLHLLASAFKLGRLTQFVSYSVVLGYVTGASMAIVIGQLFVFFGIPGLGGVPPFYAKALHLITHLDSLHVPTFCIGAISVLILLGLKKWDRRIPASLIVLILTTGLLYVGQIYVGGEVDKVAVIVDAGEISDLTPRLIMPHINFQIMNSIIPFAFAVALLSILETSTAVKSIASISGQRLSINQEMLSLGMGNFTSALCGAMPVSGSTSRTLANFESGAQTRLAAIFGAVIMGGMLYIFEDFVSRIPLATLSAILLLTACSLIKKKQLLLCLRSTKSDAFVFWITFLSCIFVNIDIAFYIGVCLSIILHLSKAAVPQVLQYIIDDSGRIKSLEFCSKSEHAKIRFIKVKGELFFGAADLFQATLKSVAADDKETKVIILQLKNARDIDATACLALMQLFDYVKHSGRHLLISGITFPIWKVMSDSGLVEAIGKDNLFLIDERNPNFYFQKALRRAKALVVMANEEAPATGDASMPAFENTPEISGI